MSLSKSNEAEGRESPRAGRSRSGWECKAPHGESEKQEVAAAIRAACIILAAVLLPHIIPEGWIVDPEVAAELVGLFLFWPLYTIWKARTRGRDCVYLGDGRIVRVREVGMRHEQMWAVRLADVEAVIFKGGSFWRGELKAAIRGQGFLVRMKRGNKISGQRVSTLEFSNDVLVLHPALLERLIDLAELKATTRKEHKAIGRARRFLPKAVEKTPDPLPLEGEALERQAEPVEEIPKPAKATVALVAYSLLLVGFGFALFVHLRGSFYGFLLPCSMLLLLGSPYWLWPITSRFETNLGKLGALYALNGILVLIALFVWFIPALWFVVAAYLIFLLYCIAAVRFGPYAARQIVRCAILGCAVYVGGAVVYFGNWPAARVQRVLTIRYRSGWAEIDLSPDGKSLAIVIDDMMPRQIPNAPRYQPLRDSHLKVFRAVARAAVFLATSGSYPKIKDNATSSVKSVVFFPSGRGRSLELILPISWASWTAWSPNGERLAISASKADSTTRPDTPPRWQLWVAEPSRQTVRLLYEGEASLLPPDDLWSRDSRRLRACFAGKEARKDVRAIIHIDDGRTEVRPVDPADDLAATPTWHRLYKSSANSLVSPNDRWRAVDDGSKQQGRVVIERHPAGEPVAAVTLPGGDPPYLSWSPDSRKLAVSRERRTWVYDRETGKTTTVKIWRHQSYSPIVWSPDSQSFYFTRTIAVGMIGLQMVEVTLCD